MRRLHICTSIQIIRKIALPLPFVFVFVSLSIISSGLGAAKVYAQVFPPVNQFPQPIQPFPQQSLAPPQSVPLLPPPQTTFAPSIFPPTSSFIPQTSFAVPTGSLSPWFPSIPAIACGGTFSLSIVGDVSIKNSNNGDHSSKNSNNGDHNDKKTIAVQVKAAGGTALDQNSISGQIFQGTKNIKNNNGNNFHIKSISNDCQVPMFIK
jgi:hypothetical protein